jgi:predicted metal-binding membrane protein
MLLILAGLGWWWSAVSAGDMGGDGMSMGGTPMEPAPAMSLVAFLVAWVAMMAAMMFALKSVCLRHCRSPLSFFMRHGKHLDRPTGAFVAGARHGVFCVGCCWMLMAVLVAFGTMQLAWMLVFAVLILLEKAAPFGEQLARVTGAALLVLGVVLLVHPAVVTKLV